jgi:hypothetical protein
MALPLARRGALLALGLVSMGGFVAGSLAALARAADPRAMLVVVGLSLGVFAGTLLRSDSTESALRPLPARPPPLSAQAGSRATTPPRASPEERRKRRLRGGRRRLRKSARPWLVSWRISC